MLHSTLSAAWDDELLKKAYQQGYVAGSLGYDFSKCPYVGDIPGAAWEAGWEDGVKSGQTAEV